MAKKTCWRYRPGSWARYINMSRCMSKSYGEDALQEIITWFIWFSSRFRDFSPPKQWIQIIPSHMGSSLVQSQQPSHLRKQLGARQSIGCWAAHLACHRVERSSYGKTTETTIETIGNPWAINTPYVVVKYTICKASYTRVGRTSPMRKFILSGTLKPLFLQVEFQKSVRTMGLPVPSWMYIQV
jgi:hypothetical protein